MNEGYYNGQVLRFRAFRMKCRISLAELSQASGISIQRISQIELMDCPVNRTVDTCTGNRASASKRNGCPQYRGLP